MFEVEPLAFGITRYSAWTRWITDYY